MSTCIHDTCGQPRRKHGPPPKGWIHVKVSREEGAWYCSPEHAWAALGTQPPPPRPARTPPLESRHDVANCPLCINRHDRGHRCGICNNAPQIVAPAPPPTRLYHHHTEERTA